MTNRSSAPSPSSVFEQVVVLQRSFSRQSSKRLPVLKTRHSFEPLLYSPEMDWQELQLMFSPHSELMAGRHAPLGRPTRLEFIWDEGSEKLGVVVLDRALRPIVHCVHALLGGNGPCYTLSSRLMQMLGVSDEMIHEIHAAVWRKRNYIIVVGHDNAEGTRPSWTWEQVR